eukprot:355816-Chlamydomonas_euryale.AAC.6
MDRLRTGPRGTKVGGDKQQKGEQSEGGSCCCMFHASRHPFTSISKPLGRPSFPTCVDGGQTQQGA